MLLLVMLRANSHIYVTHFESPLKQLLNKNVQADNKELFGSWRTDLSKAFKCLSDKSLPAKRHAYSIKFAILRHRPA